jgi:hypothetical protein
MYMEIREPLAGPRTTIAIGEASYQWMPSWPHVNSDGKEGDTPLVRMRLHTVPYKP